MPANAGNCVDYASLLSMHIKSILASISAAFGTTNCIICMLLRGERERGQQVSNFSVAHATNPHKRCKLYRLPFAVNVAHRFHIGFGLGLLQLGLGWVWFSVWSSLRFTRVRLGSIVFRSYALNYYHSPCVRLTPCRTPLLPSVFGCSYISRYGASL